MHDSPVTGRRNKVQARVDAAVRVAPSACDGLLVEVLVEARLDNVDELVPLALVVQGCAQPSRHQHVEPQRNVGLDNRCCVRSVSIIPRVVRGFPKSTPHTGVVDRNRGPGVLGGIALLLVQRNNVLVKERVDQRRLAQSVLPFALSAHREQCGTTALSSERRRKRTGHEERELEALLYGALVHLVGQIREPHVALQAMLGLRGALRESRPVFIGGRRRQRSVSRS